MAFVSSPLGRAQATMKIVRQELGLANGGYVVDDRLLEIDHGNWVGKTEAAAKKIDSEFFEVRSRDKWNVRMPRGESYADLAARVQNFLDTSSTDTVIVTHGAVTQVLRGLCAGVDPVDIPHLDEPQGVVFRVRASKVRRLE